jgi:hypothetical protein
MDGDFYSWTEKIYYPLYIHYKEDYHVDNLSTFFSLSTQDIDRFCTKYLLVDKCCAHIVTVVDKLRKGIAPIAII